jgi:hypothetical protein
MATAATHATFSLCQWGPSIAFVAALLSCTQSGRYLDTFDILLPPDLTYGVVTVK